MVTAWFWVTAHLLRLGFVCCLEGKDHCKQIMRPPDETDSFSIKTKLINIEITFNKKVCTTFYYTPVYVQTTNTEYVSNILARFLHK